MATDLMSLIRQAGFTGAAANTMYGIVMAESGGNARAYNGNAGTGDNSYGLAQINMIGSMGPARLKQYGLSSNEDLFNPLTNLKVAYALSNGGKDFTPWTTFTSGAYRNAAPGAVVSNESTQTAGSHPVTATTASKVSAGDLATEAGLGPYLALFNSVPELKQKMADAINSGMSPADFADSIQKTKWWATHSDSVRKSLAEKTADPATYRANVAKLQQQIADKAHQLGVALSPAQLAQMAQQGYVSGWNDQQIQHALGSHFNRSGQLSGQAAQVYDQLAQTAEQYGQNLSDATLRFRVQQVIGGNQDVNGYLEQIKNAAKVQYPGWAQQIDSGMTVADLASPYKQQMGSLLEINPDSVKLTDPLLQRALQGTSQNGRQPLSLGEFQDQLRKDARWQYTDNAKQAMATALTHIGRDFGFGGF